ncbi:hypothetical protein GCM10025734_29460 [Kitasatospora paranensis]
MARAIRGGTAAVRPKPRLSMAAASATERSSAPSSTGSPTLSSAATPRSVRPRSRRAARSRRTSATRFGAKVIATTAASPASYRAPGRARSSRLGEARALAAPRQTSSTASRSPSYSVNSRDSRLIGPPIRTPCAQSGSGSRGRVSSTWVPGTGEPSSTVKPIRIASTTRPSRRKAPYERDHGSSPRRAATT